MVEASQMGIQGVTVFHALTAAAKQMCILYHAALRTTASFSALFVCRTIIFPTFVCPVVCAAKDVVVSHRDLVRPEVETYGGLNTTGGKCVTITSPPGFH